jgi:hypothetical protein
MNNTSAPSPHDRYIAMVLQLYERLEAEAQVDQLTPDKHQP